MNKQGEGAVMSEAVDIHIHVVGTGDSGSGCSLSAGFASGSVFASILDSLNITPPEASDGLIEEILLDFINSSEKIRRSVLLSTDAVYKNSRPVEAETCLMASNDYVARIARGNGRVLFGASVHPYRDKREMVNEVDRCLDLGAVLFHWMPCIQQIDPEDDRCIPFYIRLARAGVPLLCHTAAEFAVRPLDVRTAGNGGLGKMVKPLDIGVKVIVAGSTHLEELIEMLAVSEEKRWDFYADISCLFTPEGLFHLDRIMKEIDRGTIAADRIIYGSNFPASQVPREALVPACEERSSRHKQCNPLDERYEVARNLGVPASAFTSAWRVLRPLSR